MEDKIIIDRMDAEEFLEMLMDAANQDNPNQYPWTYPSSRISRSALGSLLYAISFICVLHF